MLSEVDVLSEQDGIPTFYEKYVETQWSRFDEMARLEEYVLHKSCARHLPPAPATVVDIGGGNGRHAFHLAKDGYQVRLCDVTPGLVDDALARNSTTADRLASAQLADARDLPWPDNSADAALMLGPMYCLSDANDRHRALTEAVRVLRPGAPVLIQFFMRVSALRSLLEVAPAVAAKFHWRSFLESGRFHDDHIPDYLRVHYFSTPEEAVAEVSRAGLRIAEVRGMDGPAPSYGQRNLAKAPASIVEQWGEVAYFIGDRQEYYATSAHLLIVARKESEHR